MAVQQANKLMIGLFPQSKSGQAFAKLSDASYKKLLWANQSIIPQSYDFTNVNRAGTTVETVERAFITDLAKVTKYARPFSLPLDGRRVQKRRRWRERHLRRFLQLGGNSDGGRERDGGSGREFYGKFGFSAVGYSRRNYRK